MVLATPAAARAQATSPALPTLTTIGAIRALSQDEGARGYPVRVRGIVTHIDEQADVSLIVHDGQLGQFFMPPTEAGATAAWRELQRGDLVEIEGRTVRGGFAPNVVPKIIRRLGQAPLPRPKTIAFGSMLSGRHDCDYVEITGVVQRAWRPSDPQIRTLFMDVAVEEGVVRAAFWDFGTQDFERFIDARVRLRGNVGSLFGRTEQLRGVSLFVGHTGDIVVLEPPPDPATLVTRPTRSIYNYSSTGEVNRRVRIRGVVTSYIPGRPVEISDFTTTATFRYVRNVLYVDDGTGGARIETEQPQRVEPGTIVDVAGFPAVTPGKPILTNAVFRVAGMAPQPAAAAVSDANVLSAGQRRHAGADAGALPQRAEDAVGADAGAAHRGERLPGDARGGARRGVLGTASCRDDRGSHRRLRVPVGTFAVVPALSAVERRRQGDRRRRHGGRSGTPA